MNYNSIQISTKNISIKGLRVPILQEKVNKIAFIGDTGCRINMLFEQECNLLDSLPFKKKINSISLNKPDLIIRVGDYHYR